MARWMIENGSDVHQGGDGPLMRAALARHDTPHDRAPRGPRRRRERPLEGTTPSSSRPLRDCSRPSLKWLLDHGADLHAAARYCCPIEMLTCIYTRRRQGQSRVPRNRRRWPASHLPDTPVMALHRGRLDLLQEHLDRDPSLLEHRFAPSEIFSTRAGDRRAMACT